MERTNPPGIRTVELVESIKLTNLYIQTIQDSERVIKRNIIVGGNTQCLVLILLI